MKNKLKSIFMVAIMGTGLFFTSCENNESITPDSTVKYDGELSLTDVAAEGTKSITVFTSKMSTSQTDYRIKVNLTSTTASMRRVYITKNIAGAGAEPFKFITAVNTKGDGSLDIDPNAKTFSFELADLKLTNLSVGTVEYKIWATDGKGDYRDPSNSKIVGVGSIVINYGGTNPAATVKSYSAKLLAAPLSDGSSESFISLIGGKLFKIKDGIEFSALWDFGYYYGSSNHASLSSANDYPTAIINIPTIANTTADKLNKCYFQMSTKTASDFGAIVRTSDLDFVTKSAKQTITGLVAGSIVEFVDNYGKKGLIKVTEVKGTYNSGDYIKIDVKVQP
jgi:hypothetical protein